jgi:hypothetical protein
MSVCHLLMLFAMALICLKQKYYLSVVFYNNHVTHKFIRYHFYSVKIHVHIFLF